MEIEKLINIAKLFFMLEYDYYINNNINVYQSKEEYQLSDNYKYNNSPKSISSYNFKKKDIHIYLFNLKYVDNENAKKITIIGSLFESFYFHTSSLQNEVIYNLEKYYSNYENKLFENKNATNCSKKLLSLYINNIVRILNIKETINIDESNNDLQILFEDGNVIKYLKR